MGPDKHASIGKACASTSWGVTLGTSKKVPSIMKPTLDYWKGCIKGNTDKATFDRAVEGADDKAAIVSKIRGRNNNLQPIVYIGDSASDLAALLAADFGIVLGDNVTLRKAAAAGGMVITAPASGGLLLYPYISYCKGSSHTYGSVIPVVRQPEGRRRIMTVQDNTVEFCHRHSCLKSAITVLCRYILGPDDMDKWQLSKDAATPEGDRTEGQLYYAANWQEIRSFLGTLDGPEAGSEICEGATDSARPRQVEPQFR